MDPSRPILRLFGHMVERAAEWHLDHEARTGNQIVAIALRSREGFVLYRGELYLLDAEDVGSVPPGRPLSGDQCRALFGADGQGQMSRRLGRGAFAGVEIQPEGTMGFARVEVILRDGGSRGWTFPSLTSAEELVTRLEELGIVGAGGE